MLPERDNDIAKMAARKPTLRFLFWITIGRSAHEWALIFSGGACGFQLKCSSSRKLKIKSAPPSANGYPIARHAELFTACECGSGEWQRSSDSFPAARGAFFPGRLESRKQSEKSLMTVMQIAYVPQDSTRKSDDP